MKTKSSLTLADAEAIMDAAMNEAVKNNYGVAIAVADECGKLLCLKRMAHVPPVYSSVA